MKDNRNTGKNTNRRRTAMIAALISVCMIAAGCSSQADQADAVKSSVNTSSVSTASDTAADTESDTADSSEQKSSARESQTIKIERDTETEVSDTEDSESKTEKNETAKEGSDNSTSQASAGSTVTNYISQTGTKLDTADLFSDRDLTQDADTSDAQTITVSDGKTIDITEAGVYILTGTATDCTVRVNTDSESKVQLVLDNVSITNSDFPAIYVVSADKCFVTTASGSTNSLSVTGTFTADGDTNTDAVIYSKDDLVLNGLGTLSITSNSGNGISCKDDLKITGGTYNIVSALDSIEANDSIRICGGTFSITSGKDGLHCENDEDNTVGWILISDGSFDISAKSDGVQANTVLQIDGGTFEIVAAEGFEATYVQINNGTVNISATDDGINATSKSTAETVCFEMNDGSVTISMGSGDVDGIDSNGNVIVSGGTIDITVAGQGMAEGFDYDGTATYNGGTIIINGTEQNGIPTPMMGGGRGGMGDMGGMDGGNMRGQGGFGRNRQ